MRKGALILALLFLGGSNAEAQFDNIGTSAANFLKIGVGARAEAMGEAMVGQADDITALYWNVAGLGRLNHREVGFARTDWILDVNHSFFGLAIPLGRTGGTLGLSFSVLTMGEIEQTTAEEPEGTGITFTPGDLAVGVAYARMLTDRFSVGVQGKYIRENVGFSSAEAFAVDFGTLYVTSFRGMKIGMAISNFGSKMRLRGRELLVDIDIAPEVGSNPDDIPGRLETKPWPLPLNFRLGVSMDLLSNERMRFTTNFDYNDPRDVNPLYNLGAEYSFNDLVFLRGGIINQPQSDERPGDPQKLKRTYRFTLGGGLNWRFFGSPYHVKIDYAYTELNFLAEVHRFTVMFDF